MASKTKKLGAVLLKQDITLNKVLISQKLKIVVRQTTYGQQYDLYAAESGGLMQKLAVLSSYDVMRLEKSLGAIRKLFR